MPQVGDLLLKMLLVGLAEFLAGGVDARPVSAVGNTVKVRSGQVALQRVRNMDAHQVIVAGQLRQVQARFLIAVVGQGGKVADNNTAQPCFTTLRRLRRASTR